MLQTRWSGNKYRLTKPEYCNENFKEVAFEMRRFDVRRFNSRQRQLLLNLGISNLRISVKVSSKHCAKYLNRTRCRFQSLCYGALHRWFIKREEKHGIFWVSILLRGSQASLQFQHLLVYNFAHLGTICLPLTKKKTPPCPHRKVVHNLNRHHINFSI